MSRDDLLALGGERLVNAAIDSAGLRVVLVFNQCLKLVESDAEFALRVGIGTHEVVTSSGSKYGRSHSRSWYIARQLSGPVRVRASPRGSLAVLGVCVLRRKHATVLLLSGFYCRCRSAVGGCLVSGHALVELRPTFVVPGDECPEREAHAGVSLGELPVRVAADCEAVVDCADVYGAAEADE